MTKLRLGAGAAVMTLVSVVGVTSCADDAQTSCTPVALAYLGVLTGPDASKKIR